MKKRVWLSMLSSVIWTVVICALVFGIGFLIAKESDSSDLEYNSLDYDVQVLDDGDLRIRQIVDVRLHEREDSDDDVIPWKQLYQTYTLKASQLTNITDVSVKNLDTGEEYAQTEPKNPKYLSTSAWNREYARHWYIADVTSGASSPKAYDPAVDGLESRTRAQMGLDEQATMASKTTDADSEADADESPERPRDKDIEIGWNIPATNAAKSMRFEIAMTWEGVATEYNDVTKFQWEPFGPENMVPIGVVRGTVTFPKGTGERDSWAWLHYAGNSLTKRVPGGLEFTAYNVRSRQHLDLVAMMTNAHVAGVERHVDGDAKQWTIDDETRQERAWHDQQHRRAVIRLCIWIAVAITVVLLSFFGIRAALRSRRAARLTSDIDYWRDVPAMTPGAAAVLWTKIGRAPAATRTSREMAATMMSLIDKKYIAVYPGEAKRYAGIDLSRVTSADVARLIASGETNPKKLGKTSTIVLLPRVFGTMVVDGGGAAPELCRSEQRLLSILREAYERLHTPVFDIKQMNKAFRQWEDGHLSVELFTDACDDECAALGATQHASPAAVTLGIFDILVGVLAGIYFMASDGNVLLTCCLSLPAVFCGLFACIANKDFRITESGQRTIGELVGFDRYLEDFSEFSDREVLDVTLWGRYLVYAAALGVSRKVLQQLAAAYPQVNDAAWLDDNAAASGVLFWSARPSTIVGASLGSALAGGSFGAFSGGFVDFGTQLSSGMASVQSTISAAAPSSSSSGGSGGSFSGGGFGGSSGGSGGGSFGGR